MKSFVLCTHKHIYKYISCKAQYKKKTKSFKVNPNIVEKRKYLKLQKENTVKGFVIPVTRLVIDLDYNLAMLLMGKDIEQHESTTKSYEKHSVSLALIPYHAIKLLSVT